MKQKEHKDESLSQVNVQQRTPRTLQIEQFLSTVGNFRHNVVNGRFEVRRNNSDSWITVDRLFINSLRRILNNNDSDIKCSREQLESIIESDFSPESNPLKEYINSLPNVSGTNNLKLLLSSVRINNDENWEDFMTKWLVAVIANVMNDTKCCNHTCLVLSGGQGIGKTTWLNNLCPQSLRHDYLFIGKFDPDNKDSLRLVAERFLINIDDQLQNINRSDEDKIKAILTQSHVSYRKPYDLNVMDYPHRASFMASVNGFDFLTDATGSRRFLAFEVESIDLETLRTIDMDMVYAECKALLNSGFRYWFNDEETLRLDVQNRRFMSMTLEYQILTQMFHIPGLSETGKVRHLTATQIRNEMNEKTAEKLNFRNIGRALARLVRENGLVRKCIRVNGIPQHCYLLVQNTDFDFKQDVHPDDNMPEYSEQDKEQLKSIIGSSDPETGRTLLYLLREKLSKADLEECAATVNSESKTTVSL